MKIWLQEMFGASEPQYMMGVAFETYTYDENKDMKVKRRGWEVPYMHADPHDIDAYATKYQIPGRRQNDARKVWESEEPFKDGMTGEETYYILYVKHPDGSDISLNEFEEINEILNDVSDEGMGIKTIPRPLVLRW